MRAILVVLVLIVGAAAGAQGIGPSGPATGPPTVISALPSQAQPADPRPERVIDVFTDAIIDWNNTKPAITEADGFVVRHQGHTVERTVNLPRAPREHRNAQRIIAVVEVEPIYSRSEGREVPNDKWTRLGNVTVLSPSAADDKLVETELVRFITGYGAAGVFEQDVTPLAPLLYGRQTLRAFISSYSANPGWRISVRLRYTSDGVGQRRPSLARHLFASPHVTAKRPKLVARIMIPDGTEAPRLRIITSGHATDGTAENEFVTCTHRLRVDGREVARWRPWTESGGALRGLNPWAARQVIDGRELRASDLDRSGWHPGLVVEPLTIPLPELTPGRHLVELEIRGIRAAADLTADGKRHHGYWFVSAAVVADDPWPVK
ncbi:MAG: hypothetical protein GY715_12865 [Planctomycetes bacterium]|nr:hypothetical protein [Planctomycetota bacterium]